ncbi:MAG: hypothetical protein QM760_15000 [Nibricoccus sp.]
MRWIDDPDLPLSKTKKMVNQKLGNKVDSTLTLTYNPTFWMNLNSSLIMVCHWKDHLCECGLTQR